VLGFVAERLSWIGEIHLRPHAKLPAWAKLQSEHSFLNSPALNCRTAPQGATGPYSMGGIGGAEGLPKEHGSLTAQNGFRSLLKEKAVWFRSSVSAIAGPH
jgi:hypothetical protein